MYKLKNWLLYPIRMKKSRKKGIHKKALRFVYNGSSISSTLKEAITKDKSVTLRNRTIQVFVNEMFKVKNIFIITIGNIFRPCECCCKFRNTS